MYIYNNIYNIAILLGKRLLKLKQKETDLQSLQEDLTKFANIIVIVKAHAFYDIGIIIL